MRVIKYISCALVAILIFAQCSKEETPTFSAEDSIYFHYEKEPRDKYFQLDKKSYSFFLDDESVKQYEMGVIVQTLGDTYNYDRLITVEQTNVGEENAAVAGVHYIPFDDPEMQSRFVVKANEARAVLPIILLRNKDLKDKTVKLTLKMTSNEFFTQVFPLQNKFEIEFNDLILKPDDWDTFWGLPFIFGPTWGQVKMKFIMDQTGYTAFDASTIDYGYAIYLGDKCETDLQKYNKANPDNPLMDKDEHGNDVRVVFK